MTYRDDLDAAQARIDALERELATARAQLAEAEDRRTTALVKAEESVALAVAGSRPARALGGPRRIRLARTFDGELDPALFEDLVELIRITAGDAGRTEVMKGSLVWTSSSPTNGVGPFLTAVVTSRKGKVTLTVEDRLGNLAGIVYGAIGGGVVGGGLALPIFATIAMPVLAPLVFGVWLGGGFFGCRAIFKRAARRRAEQAQALFDEVAAEIVRNLRPAPAP